MNPKNTLISIGFALLVLAPSLRADAAAYSAILKERETVLSKIVADIERRHSTGVADDEAVWSAKLALYSFRRDAAPTSAEKLRHQEQIVALQEEKLRMLKARSQTSDPLEVLHATDAVLAAQQLLDEIQMEKKKG